jgi:anti-sigma-K factor RskA
MNTEHHINELIRREKETGLNPFLVTRVMAKIEGAEKVVRIRAPFWQTFVLATSIVVVTFLGITIGNSYEESSTPEMIMNINDRQIENLGYYNFAEDE